MKQSASSLLAGSILPAIPRLPGWFRWRALMRKEKIVKKRHGCGTFCMLIGPAIFTFIGGLAAFILDVNNIDYEVRPLQTQEKAIMGYTAGYTFNPFPLDCAAIAPPQENQA